MRGVRRARRPARWRRSTIAPCASATWRTMARPSPEPGCARPLRAAEEVVEELPELVLRRARTVVADLEHAVAQPDLDHARPAGCAPRRCRARCSTARPSRSGTPAITHGSSSSLKRDRRARGAAARATASATSASSATSSIGGSPSSPRASSMRSPTSPLSSSDWLDHVVQQRAPLALLELGAREQDLHVGPQRRSPGCAARARRRPPAGAARPASACTRSSMASKRCAMRPTSSSPRAPMRRPRSPVASMCSAARVSSRSAG